MLLKLIKRKVAVQQNDVNESYRDLRGDEAVMQGAGVCLWWMWWCWGDD